MIVEDFLRYLSDTDVKVYADNIEAGETLLVFDVEEDEYGVIFLVQISCISYAITAAEAARRSSLVRDKIMMLEKDDSPLETGFVQTVSATYPTPSGYLEEENLFTSLVDASLTLGRN